MLRWLRRLFTEPEIRGYQPLPPIRRDPPPMPACKPARDRTQCRACYGGQLPCVCWRVAPPLAESARAADMWDVAQAAEPRETEPGRVEYRFLGVTGEEDA